MIISDNAAQFKLVKNVVDKQWKELTFDKLAISRIMAFVGSLPLHWPLGKEDSLKDLWDW